MFVSDPITPEQLEALALTTYIDELSRRLENHEYEIESEDDPIPRPPSPPPEYDRYGKRINTREHRLVRELEVERTLAVYRALELIPNYVPPESFTKLTRCTEKFYLPVRSHPEINFIGLLLGPRGNNLRHMESESGAKISIRGRGSVKEGSVAASQPGNDEELHCVVTALSQESIKRAFTLIQKVVDTAIESPEHQNDFKRLQLRELAELNGTLRDYENQLCSYCHQPGHRKFACPLKGSSEGSDRRSGSSNEKPKVASSQDDSAVEEFLNDIGEYDAAEDAGNEQQPQQPEAIRIRNTDSSLTSPQSKEHGDKTNPITVEIPEENTNHTSSSVASLNSSEHLKPAPPPSSGVVPGPPGINLTDTPVQKLTSPPRAPPGISFGGGSLAPPPAFKLPPPPPAAFKEPATKKE